MGNFDDTNVDKNLLSQIFADDDDDIMNGLLEENPEEFNESNENPENHEDKKTAEDKSIDKKNDKDKADSKDLKVSDVKEDDNKDNDETKLSSDNKDENRSSLSNNEESLKNREKINEPFVSQNSGKSEDKENNIHKSDKKSVIEDDIVRKEALKALEVERKNGTITTITEKTTINSSLSSDGSLEVMGTINGDIDCLGKVYVSGTVLGSVTGSEIYINTPRLTGGLLSESILKIGAGTIIVGDVTGTSAYIGGAVKGNIDVDGPVIIDSTAIIRGDIKAKSIKISEGAVVDGYVSLDYADVDLDKFFK